MVSSSQTSAIHTSPLIPQWISAEAFRQHSIEIQNAKGVYLYDVRGHKTVDFYSQVMATSLGHGLPIITEALKRQSMQVSFLNTIKFTHPIVNQYCDKLSALLPESINRIFFTVSGAESTEAAIKVARQVTGRRKVLYRQSSYHGASYGALSVSGDPRQKLIDGYNVPYAVQIPHPGHCDANTPVADVKKYVQQVENIIKAQGPEDIACLIVETVTGGSGMFMPAPGMFKALRSLADKYGFLIIADEVMTGFGRTGTMWAFEQENFTPDIITMAKGINNGTCPLGAVAVADHLAFYYEDKPFPHGATNSTHLLSIAAADATLDYFLSNRVLEGVASREAILRDRLQSLCDKGAAKSFRLRGLMGAIVLNPMESSPGSGVLYMSNANLLDALYKRGLYTLMKDNLLLIGPPLTITEQELHEAMDAIEDVLVHIKLGKDINEGIPINQVEMWDSVTVDQWKATTTKLGYAYGSAVSYIQNIVKHPENALILEIGSGTGEMISQFNNSFLSCWGIEYQKDFVEECRASHPSVNIIHGDAKKLSNLLPLDFARNANEVLFICLTNTLGNMSSSDMCKIVDEMTRVLPDRGEIVLGFTARKYFDSVVRGVFQTNPDLFGEVARNDDTGEIMTSTGYYSKLYDEKQLAELLGDGWKFETVDKTIYCRYAKQARKAQLYYDDDQNLEIHKVLGNNEMHVGLYTELNDPKSPSIVDRSVMVDAERKATTRILDMSNISAGAVIAEFGSGFGNAANLAMSREIPPALYYCIDISAANINIARKLNAEHPQDRVKYLVRDFTDTGIPDQSVDVVISQDSLLHGTAVMDQVLLEAARILIPGGRLIFTDIMQSEEAKLPAALAARLGMDSLMTPQSYKELAQNVGLTFTKFDNMSHNLHVHYSSFQDQVRRSVKNDNVSPSYIEDYGNKLQVWIDCVSDLRWGYMEFKKLPPNCRCIEYPWVHFMNHCDTEDNEERFRVRTALGPVVHPSEVQVESNGFTIHWDSSTPPSTIRFGEQNEFLEDVIFWSIDRPCPSETSVKCWVTDVDVGVSISVSDRNLLSNVSTSGSIPDFVELRDDIQTHFKKLTDLGLEKREMEVEEKTFLNRQSAFSAIGWHTDNPFDYDTPQFVCLIGETVEHPTPTFFAESGPVLERLEKEHPEHYNLLRTNHLYMSRFIPSEEHDMNISMLPRHVINDSGDVFLSCITQRVPSQSNQCGLMYEALNVLENICEELSFSICIKPGEAVCFNNQRYFHRRPSVEPGRIIKYVSFHSPVIDSLGVIGLGAMGMPLCKHLSSLSKSGKVNGNIGGYDVYLNDNHYNIHSNFTPYQSLSSLSKVTDTVFMFLPDDSSTISCVQEIMKVPHPRTRLVINMGTTSPECSKKLEQMLSVEGHQFCEAPVSGGPAGIERGDITIMFACNPTAYPRSKTILQLLSPNLIFCGATGTASVIKLCNNFCVATNMLGFSVAAQVAMTAGCSASLLSRILNQSSGRSWCSEVHNPIPGVKSTAPGSNDYQPGFRASHMSKDLGIFSKAAANVGKESTFANSVVDVFKEVAKEHPALDFSSVFRHVDNSG